MPTRRWWLALVVAACSSSGTGSPPARCNTSTACATDGPVPLALCEICTADTDCASGICRMYGDGYRKCTTTCTAGESAPQCTGPALGGCNLMGQCMCPRIDPPTDAGPDPRDAPVAIDAHP